MEIDFLTLLRRLYYAIPNGCLCVEYWNYDNYPFCKENILKKIFSNKSAECTNLEYKDGLAPIRISKSNCFTLNKEVLLQIEEALKKYKEKGEELFDGSIIYIKNGNLLFAALNFIDTIMPPEVIINNIDIDLKAKP